VYKAKDDDGDTYYFRGYVENNYVRFAGYWWRIIRINGDGSIRIIYDGTSPRKNGTVESSVAPIASSFNNSSGNGYTHDVGFKYTIAEVHGLKEKSTALIELEKWYNNNLTNFVDKIDPNAGFCGDRTPSTNIDSINNEGGTWQTTTYYAGYIRLVRPFYNKAIAPVLTCANKSDLYTISTSNKGNKNLEYPIGLITADEISMAGGLNDTINSNFYLYNGRQFVTMTPYFYNTYPEIFSYYNKISVVYPNSYVDLRPVINLRSDIKITGKGTADYPYIIN